MFRDLGHRVETGDRANSHNDVLVAIHAEKTASQTRQFRMQCGGKTIVVVSGTDLYGQPQFSEAARDNLNAASAIVTLESSAVDCLPASLRSKTRTIYQSAVPPGGSISPLTSCFEVSVSGHLRKEKDPFLIVAAVKQLPHSSRIAVRHLGRALSAKYERQANGFAQTQKRYQWYGDQPHWKAKGLVARSRLMVNSSLMESAANSIIEAIVAGTPVLATAVPGNIGVFGESYAGLFEAKDSKQLAALLAKAETDSHFYRSLVQNAKKLAKRFAPAVEKSAWRKLLNQIATTS